MKKSWIALLLFMAVCVYLPGVVSAEASGAAPLLYDAAQQQPSAQDDGEHDHAGGQRLMALLRVLDTLACVAVAAILYVRYALWRGVKDKEPAGFGLEAERYVLFGAALLWIVTGWSRLGMLMNQFAGAKIDVIIAGTMVGKIAAARPALAALLLLLAFAPERERIWANPLKHAAVIAIIVTFPLTGHAYSAASGVVAAVLAHTVHMAAAAVWLGGLAGLLSLSARSDTLPLLNRTAVRFSFWALPLLVLLGISGIWLALSRLSGWDELLGSDYGRLLSAKVLLTLLVIGIGAAHRLVFMPRIAKGESSRGLVLGVRTEIVAAAALIVLAGWLAVTSPPYEDSSAAGSGSGGNEPVYWHVMGDDAHMTLRMNEGGQSGEQLVRLYIWLREDQGEPQQLQVAIRQGDDNASMLVPLEPMEPDENEFEFPGFTKFSYSAEGRFVDPDTEAKPGLTVDFRDPEGREYHYERKGN